MASEPDLAKLLERIAAALEKQAGTATAGTGDSLAAADAFVWRLFADQVLRMEHFGEDGAGACLLGKAGRNRWLGRKGKTRGMAMSHHTHPMGGGEGRSKGGRTPASASGTKAKGGRTRPPGKSSSTRIIRRRRSKRYGQLKV